MADTSTTLLDPVQLGRTALMVNRLWLGTVNFGGRVEEDEARKILDRSVEHGIFSIDTANIYGWRVYKGYTEEVIGRWLANTSHRDELIISTKVGRPMSDRVNDDGLSARHIVASCENSLRRLGVDHVDLYQMHRYDERASWDEVWQAMDMLVTSGKVRYVGSSNFAGWNIASAQEFCRRRSMLGLVSEQCIYNLAVRHAELEILPAAQAYGLGVFAWSPLHGGMLSGVLEKLRSGQAVKSAQGRAKETLPSMESRVEQYEKYCAEIGKRPADVGLQWVLSRPGISGAVIGPRSIRHVDDAVTATQTRLTSEEMTTLESIFPALGAGGPAPETWIT